MPTPSALKVASAVLGITILAASCSSGPDDGQQDAESTLSATSVTARATTTAPTTSRPLPSTTTTTISTTSTSSTVVVATPSADVAFSAHAFPVTATHLGTSYREGCPVGPDELQLLLIPHWDFQGEFRIGELVVHEDVADDVIVVFEALWDARFPIERMELVQYYESDDNLSMAANNTSAFNCRLTTSGSRWSEHAFGRAIDINPVQNPYVSGSTVLPPLGRAYLDRSDVRPGMLLTDGAAVSAFQDVGWSWGGDWSSPDYQHFSESGR